MIDPVTPGDARCTGAHAVRRPPGGPFTYADLTPVEVELDVAAAAAVGGV